MVLLLPPLGEGWDGGWCSAASPPPPPPPPRAGGRPASDGARVSGRAKQHNPPHPPPPPSPPPEGEGANPAWNVHFVPVAEKIPILPVPLDAPQRVVKVRRDYNSWVASETMEDYALRYTPQRFRKWSEFRVANTAFGAAS